MANRYNQFIESNFTIPVFQPDFAGLDRTLSSLQNRYSGLMGAISSTAPKHIQEDVSAASDYVQRLQTQKDSLIDTFMRDTQEGSAKMNQIANQLARDRMPGGEFYALEQRVNQKQKAEKEIYDQFLDPKSKKYNPTVGNYYLNQFRNSIPDFKFENGSFNHINPLKTGNVISVKEREDWLDGVLDRLESDRSAYTTAKGEQTTIPLKQLFRTGKTEFLKLDKIKRALGDQAQNNPELIETFDILGLANGIGENQGSGFIQSYNVDGNGNVVSPNFNTNTLLGSWLEGVSQGKQFIRQDVSGNIQLDNVALEEFKSRKRKEEKVAEINAARETVTTLTTQMPSSMPELTFDDTGKLVTKSFDAGSVSWPPRPAGIKSTSKQVSISKWLNDPSTEATYPGITDIASKFPKGNMSDEVYKIKLSEAYNQSKEIHETQNFPIREFNSTEGKDRNDELVDQRQYQNRMYYVLTPGKHTVEPVSWTQLMDMQGYNPDDEESVLEFEKNMKYGAEVTADNALTPSGTLGSVVGKGTSPVQILAVRESDQADRAKSPIYELNSVTWRGDIKESNGVNITLPVPLEDGSITEVPITVFSKKKIISRLDQVQKELSSGTRGGVVLSPDEMKQLSREKRNLINNPRSNKIVSIEPELYQRERYVDENGVEQYNESPLGTKREDGTWDRWSLGQLETMISADIDQAREERSNNFKSSNPSRNKR